MTSAASNTFEVLAYGAADNLAFIQQPSTNGVGAIITPPVTVIVRDAYANGVPAVSVSVTTTTGALMNGALITQSNVSGIATFNDLSIPVYEVSGYVLSATAGALSVTSNAFDIGTAPVITITGATTVTGVSAMLNASVNSTGLSTIAYFEWDITNTSYTYSTTAQAIGSGLNDVIITATLTSLSPDSTYYVRARATNIDGTTNSPAISFTMLGGSQLSNAGGGTWSYSRPMTITNNSAITLTNYQVLVEPFRDSGAFIGESITNTGLVGYWPMSEGTGTSITADASGQGNTVALINSPTWDNGRYGNALDFNGSSQYLTIANNLYSGQISTTTMAWVCLDAYPGNNVGIVHAWSGTQQIACDITSNGYLQFWINGVQLAQYSAAIGIRQWVHLAYTTDGTYVRIYLNGNQVATGSYSGAIPTSAQVIYSMRRSDSAVYLDGRVDELIIFNRTLSAAEISMRYGSGLVGSWHFSEPLTDTSATTVDMSGLVNNGTLTNGPTRIVGLSGNALSFDGTDDRVDVSDVDNLSFTNGVFTTEFWFKAPSQIGSGTFNYFIVKGAASNYEYGVNIARTTGLVQFETWTAAGASAGYITSVARYDDDTWHYLVATRDGNNIASNRVRLYIDGQEIGSGVLVTNSMSNTTSGIRFGNRSDLTTSFYRGLIDEARIYNRALSAAEITARYNAGTPKVKYNLADVRFTGVDSSQEYNYWQETDTRFWVKIPSLISGTSGIKLHYGNISATSSSSGANTFDFFDDFENYTLGGINGQGGWTQAGSGTTNEVSNNQSASGSTSLRHWFNSDYGTVWKSIPAQTSAFVAEWSQRHTAANSGLCFGNGTLYNAYNGAWVASYSGTGQLLYYRDAGDANLQAYTLNRWYNIKTIINPVSQNIKVYVDNSGALYNGDMRGNVTSFNTICVPLYTTNYDTYMDTIRVRKYSDIAPTHSLAGVENGVFAPTNLRAVVVSVSQVDLTWQDNSSDEFAFRVNRSFDGTNYQLLANIGANITSCADSTVTPTGTYYYQVVSYKDLTGYLYSNVVSVTISGPVSPSNLITATVYSSAIALQWADDSNNETGFEIERSVNGITYVLLATLPRNTQVYTDTGLVSGTAYAYRIRSYNDFGASEYSNIANVTTLGFDGAGGAVTYSGGYTIHTFTTFGTFTPSSARNVEVLVVAGGGSGGNHNSTNANGGGGGGGVIYNTSYPVTPGAIAVTVGNGGSAVMNATTGVGYNGGNSAFGSLIALGGGGGGSTGSVNVAGSGGSGGGKANNGGAVGVSVQVGGYGNSGGNSAIAWTGAGGGGAGSAGFSGDNSVITGGNGGTGISSTISGSLKYYGGGGGGGANSTERAGNGYDGGGRGCGNTALYAYNYYPEEVNATTRGSGTPNAIANTGGGGGAGSANASGNGWSNGSGSGGSGIVIIRYLTNDTQVNTTTNLRATVVSDTKIVLAWQDNSPGDQGFTLERSLDGIDWTVTYTLAANTRAYTDTAVSAATDYYYRVRSYNFIENNLNSNTEQTRTAGPTAPSGLITTTIYASAITLQWTDNSSNETGFEVWRSINGVDYTLVAQLDRNTTSYTDSGLAMATSYAYQVRAYNGVNNSAYSNIIIASTYVIEATGGTITYDSGYKMHTFTSSGALTVTGGGNVEVYAWGGGGAGGNVGAWGYGSAGGAGGAARGTLSVVSGTYNVVVGGGGMINSYVGAAGGGGPGSNNNVDNQYGGGGGGYSGIFKSSVSQANACIIAGGGGGGGSSRAGTGNAGGGGGGASGERGYSPYDGKTAYGGNPGTQSGPGADASCDSAQVFGGQWALQGGVVRINSAGGGGGGGYWGGSAGGYSETRTMAGGGGGSGYLHPTLISAGVLTAGTGIMPGDYANAYRGTAGDAGAVAGNGSNGVVIVRYLQSNNNIPGNLVAQAFSNTTIALTWQDKSPGENGFKIERSPEGITWTQIVTVTANATVYTDTTVSAGTIYYYRVRSYNFLVDHPYSNEDYTVTSMPNMPTDLITTTVSAFYMGLQWTDNSNNETGFRIERQVLPTDTAFSLLVTLPKNTTSYTETGLAMGTSYNYQIYSYNGLGVSAYSNMISATTLTAENLSLTFTNTSTGRNGSIQYLTITYTGNYRIEVWGAQGGTGAGTVGGLGARMRGDFYLTAGTQLKILVGQKGGDSGNNSGGGGGGTFVVTGTSNAVIIAGGGGGRGGSGSLSGLTGTSGGNSSNGVLGGTDGAGGGATGSGSGSGGGLTGNGGMGGTGSSGGISFIGGGAGGSNQSGGDGGFGGGGGGEWYWVGSSAGGGGYSGGGGGSSGSSSGGGGGSYNGGTNQSNTGGVRTGEGLMTIISLDF
ncbi:MAG TPA: DUF2341 domain-containing protein [Planctomycetota bacterium]|nr:DUF2341 domain-containing protein [Planctomycetota bacterium]